MLTELTTSAIKKKIKKNLISLICKEALILQNGLDWASDKVQLERKLVEQLQIKVFFSLSNDLNCSTATN